MRHKHYSTTFFSRLMPGALLSVGTGLLLACAAQGQQATYTDPDDGGTVDYEGAQGTYPPVIDATNFINNGTFTINWNFISDETVPLQSYLYETSDTLNYTNNSLMNSDIGFTFDDQSSASGLHLESASFYNPGSITCDYQFMAWATNIASPGTVSVPGVLAIINPGTDAIGTDGLLQFTGQNVDLTGGTLLSGGGPFINPALALLGLVGLDNFNDWDPTIDLGPTFAVPSLPVVDLAPPPFGYGFPNEPLNSTPYLQNPPEFDGTNGVILRSAFVQNTSGPNVTYNVYFGPNEIGPGDVTIEWIGKYQDPVTSQTISRYLYLNDDYELGSSTNAALNANGVPDNFVFMESTTPLYAGTQATAGFEEYFTPGFETNRYAYVSASIIATSTATNNIPNGNVTNLPSRIQISAGSGLNLTLAQISTPDFLSLQSSNQFDGNAGALIQAPFCDLHLGVTNGFLSISNLVPQKLPLFCGTIQAWSTRWLVPSNIDFPGIGTNDFRVLLVASQLQPNTVGQVQDLILHATNAVIISDPLNVMNSLSIDARSLTLTTNVAGSGAAATEGELNLESPNILWPSSLPNLLWLTNYGTIATMNLTYFGSSAQPYGAFINYGSVTNLGGSMIWAQNFLSSGGFFSGTNGSFALQSLTTTLTNGSLIAGGNVSITTATLNTSNLLLQAGGSLTLQVTNWLTDNGVTNGNTWSVGGSGLVGLNLPLLPNNPANRGDLLGTMISVTSPAPAPGKDNSLVANTWAGQNFGVSNTGYTNNAAIGVLTLDAQGANSAFEFNGAGPNNALYVDKLVLRDYAQYAPANRVGTNMNAFVFNTNLVLYYAQAVNANGTSVAELMDHFNGDHLRWVPTYAGHFSSTNLVYPDGTTNGPFNAALAASPDIDSNGNGIPNAYDPEPFFVSSMMNPILVYMTNNPPHTLVISWNSIPLATNTVLYSTAGPAGPFNQILTNFVSPIPYPSPPARIMAFDGTDATNRYYLPVVMPWLTYPY